MHELVLKYTYTSTHVYVRDVPQHVIVCSFLQIKMLTQTHSAQRKLDGRSFVFKKKTSNRLDHERQTNWFCHLLSFKEVLIFNELFRSVWLDLSKVATAALFAGLALPSASRRIISFRSRSRQTSVHRLFFSAMKLSDKQLDWLFHQVLYIMLL